MNITVGYLKTKTRLLPSLGICATDSRLLPWLNECQQRLVPKGLWIGTFGRFRLCVTDGCVSLPPQLANMERMALCGQPAPIHDQFYEFLDNGFGTRNAVCQNTNGSGGSCCGGGGCGLEEANHRGWFPTFSDIRGTAKKLRLICDVSADVGKEVLLLGYDENGNWIRTSPGGVWQDGETVALAQSPGVDSTHFFDGGVTGIQFLDDREGQVWLYERDTVAATSRMIGSYQYFETNPSYPRYLFPSIRSQTQDDGSCGLTTIELIGRLEILPLVKDTDLMLITSEPAIKEMCLGIKKAEDEADSLKANQIIMAAEAIAADYLDRQIDYYLGTGREVGLNIVGPNIGTVRPIPAFL